ncbi:MAG TPA: 3-alpha,7-alpha,12-alpha-trihydroxy-5-beta-cholest-24-enoyl-CoA hydratase [Gammaproteobacteria bacterium]|nr:3-alpha,7-alpha,12-alpha-trihydroxy-5-beta-cholest-24-enoyl-CoA hydratase [Gammaproteobacteria bacterium]|tara:strand:- start:148 stop:1005 length:858 start_codon:yes stop_codon:yes gene_type:complete
MAIDPDYLLNREWPKITQTYTEKDCMLYALGVGMGMDPLDEDELQFVFEEKLKVLPSQAVMMAHPGFWATEEDIDLDWMKILHLGQEIILHRPLPAACTVEATTRFTEIVDKGERGGALMVTDRVVSNAETGEELATLITTILARGDGGFSKERRPTRKTDAVPSREPDEICDLPTLPQQALLYRLSGDFNPLHASPAVARDVGYEAPILHGLCTMGVLTHALMKTCCDYDPARFKRVRLRFSAPVYPGETIRTEIWREENNIAFRCKSLEQDKVVINNGYLEVA